ncbi:MAG: hypothetical protein RL217_1835 [Pseudomonadota bacterium]|jgi:sigma-E factor negative regulatory protein RseA
MNERTNESLSALMDGETDELELRRLLKQGEQEPQMLDTWHRYQMIGALMRGEAVSSVDLSKGIRQAIDGEPMDDIQPLNPQAKRATSWPLLAASGAVAASVMLAVLVAVNFQEQPSQASLVAKHQVVPQVLNRFDNDAANEESVAVAETTEVASLSPEEQQRLEQAQLKLQEYVLQHSQELERNPQAVPFTRTVKFNQE